jgi:hypothetical protein
MLANRRKSVKSIKEFGGSDSLETIDFNVTLVVKELAANPKYFETPKTKKGKAKKVISKRMHKGFV